MKKLVMPSDENGWERMASNIVRANLTLANMSQRELEDGGRDERLDVTTVGVHTLAHRGVRERVGAEHQADPLANSSSDGGVEAVEHAVLAAEPHRR